MPTRRSSRFTLLLAAVSLTTLLLGGTRAGAHTTAPPTTLAACKKELASAAGAVDYYEFLTRRARGRKVVLVPNSLFDTPMLVDVGQYTEFVLNAFYAGRLTQKDVALNLVRFTRLAANTKKWLAELLAEARATHAATAAECAKLEQGANATTTTKTTTTARAARGSLTRNGTITVTPDTSSGLGITWTPNAQGNTAKAVSSNGEATYTWKFPTTITSAGEAGEIEVTIGPHTAGSSNFAGNIVVGSKDGDLEFDCAGTPAKSCAAEAYSKGGATDAKTLKFTVKAQGLDADRTTPVVMTISLGPNGPGFEIPYVVVK